MGMKEILSGKEKVKKAKVVDLGKKGKIVIKHPGALKAKAKKAGQSTEEFAQANKNAKGVTGKQANLALTLMKMNKK